MPELRGLRFKYIVAGVVVILITGSVVAAAAIPAVRQIVSRWLGVANEDVAVAADGNGAEKPAVLIRDAQGNPGLRLGRDAVAGMKIDPVEAKLSVEPRPLPPQIGTVNYDNDRLFIIRSRFPGEVAEIRKVQDLDGTTSPTRTRPLRYGDKVKQDDVLAVVWSQTLGTAKATLVDAISNLRLSQDFYDSASKLLAVGALAEGAYKQYERQLRADTNAVLTAERALRFWKLDAKEIEDIKEEAKVIAERKKIRLLDDEMKWARVEIKVPTFKRDPKDPTRPDPSIELTVVEKSTSINDMVDPISSPPLFKLADMSRLQVWVQPSEEYLPIVRSQLAKGSLKWKISFQAYPKDEPLELDVLQIAPSLDPNLRTPLVIGYLPNKESKYLVGQFVTATISVAPEPDTVEIPTNALNEVEGEGLVFVETDAAKREYILKRVAVAQRFKDVTYVRSVLNTRDKEISEKEQAKGKRALQPLLPGEKVVTRGTLQMTVALETLLAKERLEKEQAKQRNK